MAKHTETAEVEHRLDQPEAIGAALKGGKLWVGEHAVDRDVLVFDPAVADAGGDRISFYSLAQHRMRTFPRAMVVKMIRPLTDEVGSARARNDYARRAELETAHQENLAADRAKRGESLRQTAIDAHRRYLAALDIPYEGVKETTSGRRPGRRTRCHVCGIGLDDFAGAACGVCDGVLCSCGACACGAPSRSRPVR